MKNESVMKWMFLLLVVAAVPGCATHALWADANLGTWHQPSGDPALRLFHSGQPRELLVLYKDKESSEGIEATRTRAYLLYQNQSKIERQRPPKFVETESARGLEPVPVFPATNAAAGPSQPALYAILSADKRGFTIYSSGIPVGTHALPAYRDGMGQMERIALTPLAATADLTIVGGAAACAVGAIYVLAHNSGPVDFQPGPHVGP